MKKKSTPGKALGTFSETIRQAVRDSGLSLNELSRRTGADTSMLSRFMNGKTITLSTLDEFVWAISNELRVSTKKKTTGARPLRTSRTRRRPQP